MTPDSGGTTRPRRRSYRQRNPAKRRLRREVKMRHAGVCLWLSMASGGFGFVMALFGSVYIALGLMVVSFAYYVLSLAWEEME
jgi:hypothetical protein